MCICLCEFISVCIYLCKTLWPCLGEIQGQFYERWAKELSLSVHFYSHSLRTTQCQKGNSIGELHQCSQRAKRQKVSTWAYIGNLPVSLESEGLKYFWHALSSLGSSPNCSLKQKVISLWFAYSVGGLSCRWSTQDPWEQSTFIGCWAQVPFKVLRQTDAHRIAITLHLTSLFLQPCYGYFFSHQLLSLGFYW